SLSTSRSLPTAIVAPDSAASKVIGAARVNPRKQPSAADRAHLDLGQRHGRGGAEFGVAVGAGGPDAADDLLQVGVGGTGAEGGAQVGAVGGKEAGEKMAVGGEAGAGAFLAERLGDGGDHAD